MRFDSSRGSIIHSSSYACDKMKDISLCYLYIDSTIPKIEIGPLLLAFAGFWTWTFELFELELQSLQVLKDIIIPSNSHQKNLQCSITGQLNAWLITVYLTATVLYSWHPKLATYHKKAIPIRVKKKLHILPDYQNSCRIYLIESFGAQD